MRIRLWRSFYGLWKGYDALAGSQRCNNRGYRRGGCDRRSGLAKNPARDEADG
ncbi:MAG: hypothetical protein ACETWB_08890 [Anaerolineae bacterium]